MKAQEAKAITKEARKDIHQIYSAIETMAKAGCAYATFNTMGIRSPEEYKTTLTENGFKVEISENHFKVTW